MCGGSTVYEYEISQVSGATSYTWTGPTGVVFSDGLGHSGNPLTFAGQNSAGEWEVYTTFPSGFVSGNISVYASNACGNGTSTSLAVQAKPNTPGTITGSTSVCKSNTSKVYSIVAVPGATSYTWTITGGAQFVGSTTGTSVTVKYTTASSTSATLSVKANNGCGSSGAKTLAITVNLSCKADDESVATVYTKDASAFSLISAYPNPTSGNITVSFVSASENKYALKVADVLGKELMIRSLVSVTGDNSETLNLVGLPAGVYFLSMVVDGSIEHSEKIIIQ